MVVNYKPITAPIFYTVIVSSNDAEIGTVEGSGKYKQGEIVTVTAQEVVGSGVFAGWYDNSGTLISTSEVYTFSATEDLELTAKFNKLYTYTITIADELGALASMLSYTTIRVGGQIVAGEINSIVSIDNQISIEIELNRKISKPRCIVINGEFLGILEDSGDEVSKTLSYASCKGQIDIDFERSYLVTVLTNIENAGTPIGAGRYPYGYELTLVGNPNEDLDYTFGHWEDSNGNTLSTDNEYTVTITSNATYKAVYEEAVTVTLLLGLEGAAVLSGAGKYKRDSTVTVGFTKNEGYLFLGWQNSAGETVSLGASYTFTATSDVTLTAAFAAPCYVTIVTNIAEGGTPTGAGMYELGATVTVNANVADGYTLVNWQDEEGNILSTEQEYSFVITQDVALLATYEEFVSLLPRGYTELEYIANPNLGYTAVTTIVYGNNVYMDVEIEDGANGTLIGNVQSTSSSPYKIYIRRIGVVRNGNDVNVSVYAGNKSSSLINDIYSYTGYRTGIISTKPRIQISTNFTSYIEVNGERQTFTVDGISSVSGNPPAPRILGPSYSATKCKLYEMTVNENQWIPAKAPDGKIGLYDIANDKFYPSEDTTKPFTAGPELGQGMYPRNVQYLNIDYYTILDTKFTPANNTTRVVFDIEPVGWSGASGYMCYVGSKSGTWQYINLDNSNTLSYSVGSTRYTLNNVDIFEKRTLIDYNLATNKIIVGGQSFDMAANTTAFSGSVTINYPTGRYKLFGLKIYNGATNELLHDYIPAVQANGKVALYDNLSGTFIKDTFSSTATIMLPSAGPFGDVLPIEDWRAINAFIEPARGGYIEGDLEGYVGKKASLKAIPSEVEGVIESSEFVEWVDDDAHVILSDKPTYSFDVTDTRNLTARFDVTRKPLPNGYIEVEYIRSLNQNCNIDTGIKLNLATHRVVMDIEVEKKTCTTDYLFEMSSTSYKVGSTTYYLYYYAQISNNNVFAYRIGGGSPALVTTTQECPYGERIMVDINTPDFEAWFGEAGFPVLYYSLQSVNTLYLFTRASSGTSYGSFAGKMYSCQIYSGNDIVGDFVPCIDPNGKVGLYNVVDDTFHTATNTTAVFEAGPPLGYAQISIVTTPFGAGSVSQKTGYYKVDEPITLNAIEDPIGVIERSTFLNWTVDGEIVGTEPTLTYTPTKPCTITANFKAIYMDIPDGYTPVEYIEVDTAFRINTGKTMSFTTGRCVMGMEIGEYVTNANGYQWVIGNAGSTNTYFQVVRYPDRVYLYSSNTVVINDYTNPLNEGDAIIIDCNYPAKSAQVGKSEATLSQNSYTAAALWIGGQQGYSCPGKIYFYELYNSGAIQQRLYPCIRQSDNAVGMYDLVENKFYTNANSGAVTPGPEVEVPPPTTDIS